MLQVRSSSQFSYFQKLVASSLLLDGSERKRECNGERGARGSESGAVGMEVADSVAGAARGPAQRAPGGRSSVVARTGWWLCLWRVIGELGCGLSHLEPGCRLCCSALTAPSCPQRSNADQNSLIGSWMNPMDALNARFES